MTLNVDRIMDNMKNARYAAAYAVAVGPKSETGLLRLVPGYMQGGVVRYIVAGYKPGSFLHAFLAGDLFGAMAAADDDNLYLFPQYRSFFGEFAPPNCCGSLDNVTRWCASGGLIGQEAETTN